MTQFSRSWLFRAVARVMIASQVLASVPVLAAERPPEEEAAATNASSDPTPAPTPEPAPAPPPAPQDVRVNRTVPEVEPPPAFPSLSQEPTDEEIHKARVFGEPLIAMAPTDPGENKALAGALNSFLRRTKSDEFAAVERFLSDHPNSPWRMSLLCQLGASYRRTGYFTKALRTWEEAWKAGKEATEPKARATAETALGDLLELNMLLGRYEVIEAHAEEIEGRDIGGSAHEKIVRAREGAWILRHAHHEAVPSAAVALDQLMALGKTEHKRHPKIAAFHGKLEGASLGEVHQLATDIGLKLQMAYRPADVEVPVPSVVHFKVGHFSAVVKQEGGKYLFKDPILGDELWLSREALNHETTGYFLVASGRLPKGWRGTNYTETQAIRGKCTPPVNVIAPAPPPPCDPNDPCCPKGMASHTFHSMLASLHLRDTPVGYAPPRGPAVNLTISYNHREALQPSTFYYSNVGPKWTFNWLSYVEDDPLNPSGAASIYGLGGGQETFTGFDPATQSYAPSLESRAVLVRTSSSPVQYERRLPDGSAQVFSQPDGATVFPRRVFLTQTRDPQGNAVGLLYDGSLRLVSITDAIGQVTALSYENPSDPLKITKVTDPFGRIARFDYNAAGQLERITDVVGLTSEFEYGTSDFVTALTTPYGTTTFTAAENLSNSNSYYRSVEATDPLGGKERLEYRWYEATIPSAEPATAVPTGFTASNVYLSHRNSFYWDKRAMALHPGDYTKAKITRWLYTPAGTFVSYTKHSEKLPLENRVWYAYPSQPDHENQGTLALPTKVARVLDDGASQIYRYEYNSKGQTTRETDPLARETVSEYDANEIDLLRVKQKNGGNHDLVQSLTYNSQHLTLTTTDAAGQTETFVYNPGGQLVTVTNPKNETTSFTYSTQGYLTAATGPVSGAIWTLGYDTVGRLSTATDSEGYTLTHNYDAMDRLTRTTYPDGTYQEVLYNRLDPVKLRDRLGRWTQVFFDPLQRPVAARDHLGRTVALEWCSCGSLDKLTDPGGNATTWQRDAKGRVTRQTRADGSVWEYTYETTTSRLKQVKDPKLQEIKYEYFVDDSLKQVSHLNTQYATPSVSWTYDPFYDRPLTMVDGNGTTTLVYNSITATPSLGAGRLASVDGPLSNDTISYSYDQLGRVTSRTLNGVTSTWAYDTLGRIVSQGDAIGAFTFGYVGTTDRLQTVTYPSGQTTTYGYLLNSGDQRLQEIHHRKPGGATLSKFNYSYDAGGSIRTWTQQFESNPAKAFELAYDGVDRLVSAVQRTTDPTPMILKRYGYGYDPAGNRTSQQVDDVPVASSYSSTNRLLSQQPGGLLAFKGGLDEVATVSVQGKPALVSATNQFDGPAQVGSGSNTIQVQATDPSGNVRSNTYQVNVSGTAKTYTHDANGNLIGDGTRTFEWDGENRLIRALSGGVEVARLTYDGLGRRFQKIAGTVTRTYICDGHDILEERSSTGATTRYLYGLGIDEPLAQVDGSGAVSYYVADHLGSVVQMTNSAGSVTLTREYDPYGNLLQGAAVAGYAFTGREWDPETGLYYYRARYYDPVMGRFIGEDPIGLSGGSNFYAYVRNSPTNLSDPFGLQAPPWPPPPPSIPGGPWEWAPDPGNSRTGTYVDPEGRSASWEGGRAGHWDVDDGKGSRAWYNRFGAKIEGDHHAYKGPKQEPIDFTKRKPPTGDKVNPPTGGKSGGKSGGRTGGNQGNNGTGGRGGGRTGGGGATTGLCIILGILGALAWAEEQEYCKENPCECGDPSKCGA